MIAGVFALVSLLLGAFAGLLPFGEVLLPNGHHISLPVFIPSIDWGVITIILGASIFVDVTSRSGLFTWIAIRLTKTSRGDPLILLVFYGLMAGGVLRGAEQRDRDDHHRVVELGVARPARTQ